jgi:hypothetical protein
MKGLEGKRRSGHVRPRDGISEKDLTRLRNGARRSRSKRAMGMDTVRTAATVYDPRDPKQVRKWRNHPDRADLDGVDTAAQELVGIKVRSVTEVEKRKELVKKAVEEARRRAVKGRREAKTSEDASKAVKDALATAQAAIASATAEVKGIIKDAKGEQDRKIRRFQGKWDPERKRRAEVVSRSVGCSMFEADALIQRAKRAGCDYDLVDWDAIQGSDLEFSERVEKLDRDLRRETMTKSEEDCHVDWQMDKAQNEWNDFQAEQERRLREDFAGDLEVMERHDREIDRHRDEQRGYEDPYAYG